MLVLPVLGAVDFGREADISEKRVDGRDHLVRQRTRVQTDEHAHNAPCGLARCCILTEGLLPEIHGIWQLHQELAQNAGHETLVHQHLAPGDTGRGNALDTQQDFAHERILTAVIQSIEHG